MRELSLSDLENHHHTLVKKWIEDKSYIEIRYQAVRSWISSHGN